MDNIRVPMELSVPEFSVYTYVSIATAQRIINKLEELTQDIERQINENKAN